MADRGLLSEEQEKGARAGGIKVLVEGIEEGEAEPTQEIEGTGEKDREIGQRRELGERMERRMTKMM